MQLEFQRTHTLRALNMHFSSEHACAEGSQTSCWRSALPAYLHNIEAVVAQELNISLAKEGVMCC